MEPKRLQSKAWSCSDLVRAAATVVDMSAPPAQMVLQKELQEAAEELQGKTARTSGDVAGLLLLFHGSFVTSNCLFFWVGTQENEAALEGHVLGDHAVSVVRS